MWTAAAGAAAQQASVDAVANNLANVDTPSFKKDAPTFKEYLATLEREHGPLDIPRGPIKDKDFYPLDGRDQSFVVNDGTYTNFKQGGMRVTNSQWDLAMDGPGFLEVSTPQGPRYTRMGALKVAVDGRLVTSEGNPVLSSQPVGLAANARAGGGPATDAARFINLRDRGKFFHVSPEGEIWSGDELVAKLNVVEFADRNKLRKIGSHMYENKDATNVIPPAQTAVRQGVIETSNVNPAEEMTNLIKANRLYELDLKALETHGELLAREANDIGKVGQ